MAQRIASAFAADLLLVDGYVCAWVSYDKRGFLAAVSTRSCGSDFCCVDFLPLFFFLSFNGKYLVGLLLKTNLARKKAEHAVNFF